MDEQFISKRTVKEYADIMNVSPYYLLEVVKKETGQTALHIIRNRLYLEAQYLLTSSAYSIKEIAEQLGFDTSSHFSRFLNNIPGLTLQNIKRSINQRLLSTDLVDQRFNVLLYPLIVQLNFGS